jgi:hypothetical protein
LAVSVDVVMRVEHREDFTHTSSCFGDSSRDLNSELGVDAFMVQTTELLGALSFEIKASYEWANHNVSVV